MESFAISLAGAASLAIELIAIIVVSFGAAEAAVRLGAIAVRPTTTHGQRKTVWRRFGVWILIALEFELAADVIRSVITPSWEEIGRLGAIAVIRTFLNFFLERDLAGAEA